MNWLQALNDAWDELTKTVSLARQFRTKLISTEMPLDILAGMRASDNAPCLMLQTTLAPGPCLNLAGCG